ncbi:MAG: ATP12 family chaperone protein [Xanthobacteraceae bacterium]
MHELFDEVFENEPLDPVAAARRAVRPQLRRRFYAQAGIAEAKGGYQLVLDGRAVKTPGQRPLAVPRHMLAQALLIEWDAQRDTINPATMPLTRLANTIIDGVADEPGAVAGEIEKYLASDLVCYRADAPDQLVARQTKAWDQVLRWVREAAGAHFIAVQGMSFVPQPPQALAAAAALIPRSPPLGAWQLGALHVVTTLTGSALIGLALAAGALSLEDAWAAAHVDEDWNMEQWGRDELALQRRAFRFAEMQAAELVLRALSAP